MNIDRNQKSIIVLLNYQECIIKNVLHKDQHIFNSKDLLIASETITAFLLHLAEVSLL